MDTSHSNWSIISSVFARVFTKGRYVTLTLLVFFVAISLVLLLPNLSLITQVLESGDLSTVAKLSIVVSLYGSLMTNFTVFSAVYTLLLTALFSINLVLLVFYIRRVQKQTAGTKRAHASGIVGLISGALGIGCAACGSVILTGLATSLGATGLLLALPLHGGELALVGIAFLLVSIRYFAKKIHDPLVCPAKY